MRPPWIHTVALSMCAGVTTGCGAMRSTFVGAPPSNETGVAYIETSLVLNDPRLNWEDLLASDQDRHPAEEVDLLRLADGQTLRASPMRSLIGEVRGLVFYDLAPGAYRITRMGGRGTEKFRTIRTGVDEKGIPTRSTSWESHPFRFSYDVPDEPAYRFEVGAGQLLYLGHLTVAERDRDEVDEPFAQASVVQVGHGGHHSFAIERSDVRERQFLEESLEGAAESGAWQTAVEARLRQLER